jgi:predicted DNA-binding transcriptional regulator YafY
LALLTIQNMLEQLEPGLLGPKLKPLQQRLDDMLTGQGLSAETLSQRVRLVHAGKRRLKLKCFELVAKATLERKQITIQHFNRQTGKTAERTISPQQLVHYRDNWYVDAWCHLRKEVRSFAVDAITECEQLDVDAKELDADQLRSSMQSGYGIFGGAVKGWAKLKFTPERARWVKHEEWHPDQKGHEESDGSYVLEIPYSDERELVGDILRHGSDVEVLNPTSVRKITAEIIEKMQRQYS